jgi:outer membrane protein insertion porin family
MRKRLKLTGCSKIWLSLLICSVSVFGMTGTAMAVPNNSVKVVVLPFRINAQTDLTYLRDQIAEVLSNRLKNEGAETLVLKGMVPDDGTTQAPAASLDALGQLGRQHDADHVIWGTFTLIGDNFSLDVEMLSTVQEDAPQRFFAEGANLENLITVTNDLADRIGLTLFDRQRVSNILVQGNQRIETDAILRVIKTRQGAIFRPDALSQDLRAIYEMGYFDDVRVESQSVPEGRRIIFHVKEKPTIRRINIKGNSYIEEEDIRNDLTISTGAILNIFKIRSNIDQIEALYKGKNYHQVSVDYKIEPLANNQADLTFEIEEGSKLYVTEIRFEGNRSFPDKELKKAIQLSEKGFFYWLTSSGDLDRAALEQDVARLNAFYSNKGYINARVGEPQIDVMETGIHVTFKIEEGAQFKVGRVDLAGDLILPKEELLSQLTIDKETYFNREKIRGDILTLTDLYADRGYAYADISPRIDQNPENKTVDITFHAQKGEQVYFEKIVISGNTRTRDKVIRRELHVQEQGLFSSKGLKRSVRNLYRLDYFEDIKVDTIKGSAEDKMVLKLDVTEKPTGTFSFGAGYSSEEDVFFTGAISQRNLFGRGQTLDFSGQIGSRTSRFVMSFTEPHLFDTLFSGTVSAYNQERDYDDNYYERDSKGGGLQIGYRLADFTYLRLGYNLDVSDISPYVGYEHLVPDNITELIGTNITSSVNTSLTYDSRDRAFNTTEGSKHSLYMEYAGLGGDVGFNKVIGQTMWFLPIYKSLIGFANAKIGFVRENSGDKILPDYEKFYLGGINSLRGFGYHGVALTEVNQEGNLTEVGGENMIQFNLELLFPLIKEAGVNGVVFYDTGNVYRSGIDLTDLRRSAGLGIRWLSPIAPIRIEYGFILDRREGESRGNWEFTLGSSF